MRQTFDAAGQMGTLLNAATKSLGAFVHYVSPPDTNATPQPPDTNSAPLNVLDYGTVLVVWVCRQLGKKDAHRGREPERRGPGIPDCWTRHPPQRRWMTRSPASWWQVSIIVTAAHENNAAHERAPAHEARSCLIDLVS
jgi:hypothetical protein